MKYSAEEMALKILRYNNFIGTAALCAMGYTYSANVVIYCSFPGELKIPEDNEEQWYYNGEYFTNENNTSKIMVRPFK